MPAFFSEYNIYVSIGSLAGLVAISLVVFYTMQLIPTFKEANIANQNANKKMREKSFYSPNVRNGMLGSGLGYLVNYLIILPLSITFEFSSVWNVLFSIFIILMVYDFFYYLMHRFLFHGDNHFFKTVHAVHHQMKNPSRGDSSYLHWLEGTMGVLLFGFTVGGLSLVFGKFDLVSIVITMWLYQEINLHNHAIFDKDTFPYKTLHKISADHHRHHINFNKGNYSSITLLYDWIFGTYETEETAPLKQL